MVRPTIDNVRSLGDFATVINWNMYFSSWPNAIGSRMLNDDFNARCMSTEVPMYESQVTPVYIRGHRVNQPGIYTPTGTIGFTMVETVDNKVSDMLRVWREACWQSQTGVQQKKSDVEAILYLQRLDRQDNPIWEYIITGAFLETFDPTGGRGLTEASADVLAPTIRLSYDYFVDRPFNGTNNSSTSPGIGGNNI